MTKLPVSSFVPQLPDGAAGTARFAFLGPLGTFCEQALRQIAPEDAQVIASSEVGALDLVRSGQADYAVVPIENSVEGGVNATLDSLSHGEPLVIVAEMLVPVVFTLAVAPGTKLSDIKRLGTHPHAWAQCRRSLQQMCPKVQHVPATSTADAARLLGEWVQKDSPNPGFDAALCSAVSATRYGLEAAAQDVADRKGAVTRFVAVSKPGRIPAPTGADKTTVRVALGKDRAGGLLTMLEQFSARGVNLSRIESRPSGEALGSYEFSIDLEGHISEERVKAALIGLHRTSPKVRFLGSYPRADQVSPQIVAGTSDADFVEGRAWVERVQHGLSV